MRTASSRDLGPRPDSKLPRPDEDDRKEACEKGRPTGRAIERASDRMLRPGAVERK